MPGQSLDWVGVPFDDVLARVFHGFGPKRSLHSGVFENDYGDTIADICANLIVYCAFIASQKH
jgi:hypothetical protein